ncbi:MAG: HAD hydrolase-like protein [Clostridiales bacterium]|nr:HAD hydrolase-like protein [Clostridiales bacterium]
MKKEERKNRDKKQMRAVLFDLDGTLVDSEEGITKCVQYALRDCGIEVPNLESLRCFIGPPLEYSFRLRYGMTEEAAWNAVQKYRERYDVKGILECHLYDHVEEALSRIKEKGYLLALASSKPEIACRHILERFHLTSYFDEIVGSTLDGSISTKEEVLLEVCRRMSRIDKEQMCLIGDTKYDAIGAAALGIRCIGVSYGFGTREELLSQGAEIVLDDIREVESYLEGDMEL